MATDRFKPLLDRDFLRGELHYEYEDYVASGADAALKTRLERWAAREVRRETQAEGSFMGRGCFAARQSPAGPKPAV